jgi:trehalose utilization protein
MKKRNNITVWNEFLHEQKNEDIKKIYPKGMHQVIADCLSGEFAVQATTLDQPEQGLPDEVLNNTDVLIWWGHLAHDQVDDQLVEKVHQRVLSGMGFIALHSSHFSKIFKRLMGTNCSLKWRAIGEKERVWNVAPAHPITAGIGDYFEIPVTEMYSEPFDVPEPDRTIFISWYAGGEVFRSGCTWERGNGRVFYFNQGAENFPVFHNESVLKVIANACRWACPRIIKDTASAPSAKPLENINTVLV